LKKLAARDYEDLLQVIICGCKVDRTVLTYFWQCAMAVFEGLLPEPHNSNIQRLLFTCAHWHGLAKLRMHTDQTLEILDDVTVQLGAGFRAFKAKTCASYATRELQREAKARKRRNLQKRKKASANAPSPFLMEDTMGDEADESLRLPKTFNIQTYKYHSIGDVAKTICRYGTSDSFSSEPVCNFDHMRIVNIDIALS
jgi:hypothetical protein